MSVEFPKDFMWGVATAAYQIEGAVHEDGRGVSIWDTFSHTPGNVVNDDNGDVACDHYHRYNEDIDLMVALGAKSYRFSVAWTRIIPQGTGAINQKGLDFYSRIVDTLLEKGIVPNLTLYHWDLPQPLEDKGGWANRDTVQAYVDYADVVSRCLGDRVPYWATFNEPGISAFLGYYLGIHAPGIRDMATAVKASHHHLLAHGEAVPVLRANGAKNVGIVLDPNHVDAISDKPEDIAAARREDGFKNRWFLDPLFKGSYPEDMFEWMGSPDIHDGDMEKITLPIDFMGLNYYQRGVFGAGDSDFKSKQYFPEGDYTDQDWEIYPPGFYNMITRVSREYTGDLPLYITENGAAFDDVLVDGAVHDEKRRAFLEAHFEQAYNAIQSGVNLKGYYVWSFLDNFEWAYGYDKRFGIVYVDYQTQQRTLKDSALWYKQVIANNGW